MKKSWENGNLTKKKREKFLKSKNTGENFTFNVYRIIINFSKKRNLLPSNKNYIVFLTLCLQLFSLKNSI